MKEDFLGLLITTWHQETTKEAAWISFFSFNTYEAKHGVDELYDNFRTQKFLVRIQ